jgi:probable rRNA maturation factor
VQRAAEQAQSAGHPLEAEVQLLVVHGILHLMGHDHARAADKARMWSAQAQVLEQLGLAAIRVHE